MTELSWFPRVDVLVGVPRLMRTNEPEVVGVVSDSSMGDTTVASWVAVGGPSAREKDDEFERTYIAPNSRGCCVKAFFERGTWFKGGRRVWVSAWKVNAGGWFYFEFGGHLGSRVEGRQADVIP